MELTIDSDLNCQAKEDGCEPIVFVPDVDLFKLEEESIINAFESRASSSGQKNMPGSTEKEYTGSGELT